VSAAYSTILHAAVSFGSQVGLDRYRYRVSGIGRYLFEYRHRYQ